MSPIQPKETLLKVEENIDIPSDLQMCGSGEVVSKKDGEPEFVKFPQGLAWLKPTIGFGPAFIFINEDAKVTRLVFTITRRSDDYLCWDFDPNTGKCIKKTEVYHGRLTVEPVDDDMVHDVLYSFEVELPHW